jgi:aspartate racemase
MTINTESLPRVGILGGMGPLASAEFAVKLVQATPAKTDQDHFPTTLDSSPQIPDRPASIYGSGLDPLPAIAKVIKRLEAAGCALIVMPCNTVHHWFDRMTPLTSLPILHIADAAAVRLRELAPDAKRVGVLGARVTSEMGIYSRRLGNEWEWVYPSDEALNTLVMPAVAAVKAGDLPRGRTLFLEAVRGMLLHKLDAIVYACTEIPVVLTPADVPLPVIDSTEALARHTVAIAQTMVAQQTSATGSLRL